MTPTNRILCYSDIHLDRADSRKQDEFFNEIYYRTDKNTSTLILGDINEGGDTLDSVRDIRDFAKGPVYFVLGNHDYYNTNVTTMQASLREEEWKSSYLQNMKEPVFLEKDVCLVGVDGFYDGRSFAYHRMETMNDFRRNHTLANPYTRDAIIHGLSVHSAHLARTKLHNARSLGFRNILFATHVPCFQEAVVARYSNTPGRQTHELNPAFYVNRELGAVLRAFCLTYPKIKVTVLTGHSHSLSHHQELPNLTHYVLSAEYRSPGFPHGVLFDVGELL
jgi:3',5'-cyclic-AMP phosphodiesterase